MHEEHEIKLRLSPKAAEKLTRLAALRPLRTGRPVKRRLTSTYFDTPGFGFRNNEMALRVRQIGRRHVQTLKLPGTGAAGVQVFREYEADVAGIKPELKALGDKALRARLARKGLTDGLAPIFVTEFERLAVPIRVGSSEIEFAVDQGEIRAGGRSIPICEAELELCSGRVEDLFALALMLHEQVPFSLEGQTKAARGYRLLAGEAPVAVKGRLRGPKPGESSRAAFVAAMRAGLDNLRANEAAVVAAVDSDGVHQMRVALRRLRSIVSAFAPILSRPARATLRGEFKWLQGCLGLARDWDVFIAETLRPAFDARPDERGFADLLRAAQEARDKAYADAQTAIQSPRYTALMLQIQMWLVTDAWIAGDVAADGKHTAAGGDAAASLPDRLAVGILDQRLRKLVRLARRHKKLSEAEMHMVRIAAKKLRYAGELFAELFHAGKARGYLRRLAVIQDTLGSLNDGVTARALVAKLATERRNDPAVDRAVRIALDWGAARIRADAAQFAGLWRGLARAKPYWR